MTFCAAVKRLELGGDCRQPGSQTLPNVETQRMGTLEFD
jgi:hypothetical protein